MRLQKRQREALLAWISDGQKTDEINRRAAAFTPPFSVSTQQVDYYRDSRGVRLAEIQEAGEESALTTGLARKEERVRRLARLAELLEEDLFTEERLWLDQIKSIGTGENFKEVKYEEFNTAEIQQYRGILDDIAKEMGERSTKQVNERELEKEWVKTLEHLRTTLEPHIYAQIVAALSGGAEGSGESSTDV